MHWSIRKQYELALKVSWDVNEHLRTESWPLGKGSYWSITSLRFKDSLNVVVDFLVWKAPRVIKKHFIF